MALDLSRSITTRKFRLIYNALWDRPYEPVDVADPTYKVGFWPVMRQLHDQGKLGEPFSTLYFQKRRPMFELYDLEKDPLEMRNLAEERDFEQVTKGLKAQLANWMIREKDFIPLPTGR